MRTCIRKIGNSRGILIPPAFLAVCGIGDHVDILMEGKSLLRRPVQEPRAGWFEGFNRLTEVIRHPNGRNGRKTDCRINHTDSHFLADITRPQVGREDPCLCVIGCSASTRDARRHQDETLLSAITRVGKGRRAAQDDTS